MKILQINSVCGIGSTGRIATDLHSILLEAGHASHVAYGRNIAQNCRSTIKIGNKLDNYIHVALTRVFDKHGFGSKQATYKFIKEIEIINPDIIHIHNVHGYYVNIEILFEYIKQTKKKVVWTLHDCWTFTGHCSHFDYIGCSKWKTECYSCPQKGAYPTSKILDNSKNNYYKKKKAFTGVENLTIVTPSSWLANLVQESFLKDYSIRTINNGINLDIFKSIDSNFRNQYGIENKFMILGVSSVWGKSKGFEYFIELSTQLQDDEVIVLVGVLEEQIKILPKNIIGITRTNDIQELVGIYSTADVFVNPTLEDTFPTVNLESLACGTPVITFNTGGSVECIDDRCGIIVEKENFDELLNAIEKVKANEKNAYTEECMSKARKLYNKNDRFNDYICLYKDILN